MKIDIKSVYINPKDYWKNTNPILPKGIIACEEETNKWKLCDGSRAFNDLPYVSDESGNIDDAESITDAKIKELVAKHEKDIKSLDSSIKENAANIESVDMNLATFETTTSAALITKADKNEVDEIKTDIDGFKSDVEKSFENVYSSEEVDEKLESMVSYQEFVRNGETRKTIQLANYDNISGVATNGTGHNLVMLSKWDVADFGATGVHMNLNTKDTVTINDKDVVVTLTPSTNPADEGKNRKFIRLNQNDALISGGTMLAFVNEWGVADFGGQQSHTNINTATKIDDTKKETGIVTINDDAAILTDKILENVIIGDGIKVETIEVPFGDKTLKQLKLSIADDILSRIEALENK